MLARLGFAVYLLAALALWCGTLRADAWALVQGFAGLVAGASLWDGPPGGRKE